MTNIIIGVGITGALWIGVIMYQMRDFMDFHDTDFTGFGL